MISLDSSLIWFTSVLLLVGTSQCDKHSQGCWSDIPTDQSGPTSSDRHLRNPLCRDILPSDLFHKMLVADNDRGIDSFMTYRFIAFVRHYCVLIKCVSAHTCALYRRFIQINPPLWRSEASTLQPPSEDEAKQTCSTASFLNNMFTTLQRSNG